MLLEVKKKKRKFFSPMRGGGGGGEGIKHGPPRQSARCRGRGGIFTKLRAR